MQPSARGVIGDDLGRGWRRGARGAKQTDHHHEDQSEPQPFPAVRVRGSRRRSIVAAPGSPTARVDGGLDASNLAVPRWSAPRSPQRRTLLRTPSSPDRTLGVVVQRIRNGPKGVSSRVLGAVLPVLTTISPAAGRSGCAPLRPFDGQLDGQRVFTSGFADSLMTVGSDSCGSTFAAIATGRGLALTVRATRSGSGDRCGSRDARPRT